MLQEFHWFTSRQRITDVQLHGSTACRSHYTQDGEANFTQKTSCKNKTSSLNP